MLKTSNEQTKEYLLISWRSGFLCSQELLNDTVPAVTSKQLQDFQLAPTRKHINFVLDVQFGSNQENLPKVHHFIHLTSNLTYQLHGVCVN